jgi:rRNA maturation RNase YbeY
MTKRSGVITFNYLDTRFPFRNREALKAFLKTLFIREQKPVEYVNYIFCTDEHLHQLNVTHLQHNTLTDIITFQYSSPASPIESDVYISVDRVRENALKFDTSFYNELLRVILHGALHLCGYKDKTKRDRELMRQMENKNLQLFSVSRGTE